MVPSTKKKAVVVSKWPLEPFSVQSLFPRKAEHCVTRTKKSSKTQMQERSETCKKRWFETRGKDFKIGKWKYRPLSRWERDRTLFWKNRRRSLWHFAFVSDVATHFNQWYQFQSDDSLSNTSERTSFVSVFFWNPRTESGKRVKVLAQGATYQRQWR